MFSRRALAALLLLTAACASAPAPTPPPITAPQTIILTGTVTRADYPSYLELPFSVPPGVHRLTLDLAYDHKGDGVTLDMGLRDPDGPRGWSGSNKSGVTLSAWMATPSYRAGPIVEGDWTLILGIPNVREGMTSNYTATITLDPELTGDAALAAASFVIKDGGPGWMRGDLHSHTGHSDAFCQTSSLPRTHCPILASVQAASDNHLDFLALTDHNTLSQLNDLTEMQALTETILIPGTEITTFEGHANVFGIIEPLDFQLGTPRLPDIDALLDQVEKRGVLLAINHPGLPSGEACMGCGWTAETDWSRIEAIEAVNGALLNRDGEEGRYSGIDFWENLLNQGHRITAIAGSDNHDPLDQTGGQPPLGNAATQVFVTEHSTRGITQGVRSGRAVVDLVGRQGASLDLRFQQDGGDIFMGGELRLADGASADGALTVAGLPGSTLEIVANGVRISLEDDGTPLSGEAERVVTITGTGATGWFRFNVRDGDTGRLQLLSNPIYVVPAD